jgi:hypothetical protein
MRRPARARTSQQEVGLALGLTSISKQVLFYPPLSFSSQALPLIQDFFRSDLEAVASTPGFRFC